MSCFERHDALPPGHQHGHLHPEWPLHGGSAADAQHLAAEIIGRFKLERPALPAIALTTDSSVLTAIGNDYGFDRVFSRQVEGLAKSGDIIVGILNWQTPNMVALSWVLKSEEFANTPTAKFYVVRNNQTFWFAMKVSELKSR